MFKRPSTHYGKSPQPETPYQRAAQVWDERIALLKPYQVNSALMKKSGNRNVKFMHCLPVRRNLVVDDTVLDGPWSVVIDEAENRLHTAKAVLLHLLAREETPTAATTRRHRR